jgi:LmbE family N-acetylglucosaminyl deacetylase
VDPVSRRGGLIEGGGTSEAAWMASHRLRALPATGLPELTGGATRLVVVAPHPDDEVLGCGGLIALAVAAGLAVVVVALTDGEAAYPDDPHWTGARLAPARRAELALACAELGVAPASIVHAGLADGGLCAALERAVDLLAGIVRAGDGVLVTWSGDGHPDHEAAADAVLRACARAGARCIQYPIWAWHWCDPQQARFLTGQAARLQLPPAVLAAKQRALACFATQTGQCTPAPLQPILPAHVLARFSRNFEVYLP